MISMSSVNVKILHYGWTMEVIIVLIINRKEFVLLMTSMKFYNIMEENNTTFQSLTVVNVERKMTNIIKRQVQLQIHVLIKLKIVKVSIFMITVHQQTVNSHVLRLHRHGENYIANGTPWFKM